MKMIGATSFVKVGTAAGTGPPALSGVEGAACIVVAMTARVPRSTRPTRFMNPPDVGPAKPDPTYEIRSSLAYLGAAGAQDGVAVVTEVTLMRFVGVALMNSP